MMDFRDVSAASKSEQIRAFAVEKAVEVATGFFLSGDEIVASAEKIEKFIREGSDGNA